MLVKVGDTVQSDLIFSDIEKFLNKYKKFMTKDIYISQRMHDNFLVGYQYLVDELQKSLFLYQNKVEYKNFFKVYDDSLHFLKLHNQKYLKKTVQDFSSFFEGLYPADILDKNMQMAILSMEDKMLVVQKKNGIPFIVGKLKYLDYLDVDLDKICILTDTEDKLLALNQELIKNNMNKIDIFSWKKYGLSVLNKEENILDESILYYKIFDYIVLNIFPNKEWFQKFYESFSQDIYLNRDYKDFDTFKDYHYYLYKRMFLSSGLSLKKFNEKEAKKRRNFLRTIDNTFVNYKEEVDIANFLYLNSIDYQYDKEKSIFTCISHSVVYQIKWDGDVGDSKVIVLDKKTKYLEVLVYELIKRQFAMELRDENEVYNMLRSTTIDSYFSDLITNILIPGIYFYKKNGNFDKTKLTFNQKAELEKIYKCYVDWVKTNHFIDKEELNVRIEKKLNKTSYEYIIVFGDLSINFKKNHLIVWSYYKDIELFCPNIKLLYDYKTYLNKNKKLVALHSFLDNYELTHLTKDFLKENLNYLNYQIKQSKKSINIVFYDDGSRLKVSENLIERISQVVELEKNSSILFAFNDMKDMRILVRESFFHKKNQNTLQWKDKIINCYVSSRIQKSSSIIVLPYLIRDQYHQDLFLDDDIYQVKMTLFMALSKCKSRIYLLCPSSLRDRYVNLFEKLPFVQYIDS